MIAHPITKAAADYGDGLLTPRETIARIANYLAEVYELGDGHPDPRALADWFFARCHEDKEPT